MDKEQLLSGLKLRNELEQNIEQFKNIVNDLQKNEHTMYFREDYIIHEYELADNDGNYDYTDYEVELAK